MTRNLIALVILSTLLPGCSSDKLSRREALKLFDKWLAETHGGANNVTADAMVFTGAAERSAPGSYCEDASFDPYEVKQAREEHLVDAGVIELSQTRPCSSWTVSLTPMALADLDRNMHSSAQPGSGYVWLLGGRFESSEVTGIVQDGPKATADVLIRFSLTPTGRAILSAGGTLNDKTVSFADPGHGQEKLELQYTRFDDGWRLSGTV